MASKKSAGKDPFALASAARACDKEARYFSVVPAPDDPTTLRIFTANRDIIFSGSKSQVMIFLNGIDQGCLIGRGISQTARQMTLGGGTTKAPHTEKPSSPGQRKLY
jgi:hypothetical protein